MVLHKMSPNGLLTLFSTRELGVMLLGSTKEGWLEEKKSFRPLCRLNDVHSIIITIER